MWFFTVTDTDNVAVFKINLETLKYLITGFIFKAFYPMKYTW